MKVILIAQTLTKGGAATGAKNLSIALKSVGIECIELDSSKVLKKRFFLKLIRTFERIIERILGGKEVHFLRFGSYTIDLQKIITYYKPDIIQLCDISANVINPFYPEKLEIPVFHRLSDFWPYHGGFHYPKKGSWHKYLIEILFKFFIRKNRVQKYILVCPSKWLLENLSDEFEKYFIRNAVDIKNIKPKLINFKDKIRLGFISKDLFLERKGLKQLISLLNFLENDYEINLLLYGKSKNKINCSNKKINIQIKNSYKKNDMENVFKSFDILICPSKYDNSPNALIEALSFGVPVIAQCGSGINSYVDNSYGRLINFYNNDKVKSAMQLNIAIKDIFANYRSSSENSLKFVENNLSKKVIGNQYKNMYLDALKKCN